MEESNEESKLQSTFNSGASSSKFKNPIECSEEEKHNNEDYMRSEEGTSDNEMHMDSQSNVESPRDYQSPSNENIVSD